MYVCLYIYIGVNPEPELTEEELEVLDELHIRGLGDLDHTRELHYPVWMGYGCGKSGPPTASIMCGGMVTKEALSSDVEYADLHRGVKAFLEGFPEVSVQQIAVPHVGPLRYLCFIKFGTACAAETALHVFHNHKFYGVEVQACFFPGMPKFSSVNGLNGNSLEEPQPQHPDPHAAPAISIITRAIYDCMAPTSDFPSSKCAALRSMLQSDMLRTDASYLSAVAVAVHEEISVKSDHAQCFPRGSTTPFARFLCGYMKRVAAAGKLILADNKYKQFAGSINALLRAQAEDIMLFNEFGESLFDGLFDDEPDADIHGIDPFTSCATICAINGGMLHGSATNLASLPSEGASI